MLFQKSKDELLATNTHKRYAWIVSVIIAAMLFLSHLEVGMRAGLAVFIYIPFIAVVSIISLLLLRLILARVFLVFLDKDSKIISRIFCVIVLAVIATLTFIWMRAGLSPYGTVKEAVSKIPEYESYFWEHEDELNQQRIDNIDGSVGGMTGAEGYAIPFGNDVDSQWLFTEYVYNANGSPKTGYKNMATYYYKLDDHWYIAIHMMSPP